MYTRTIFDINISFLIHFLKPFGGISGPIMGLQQHPTSTQSFNGYGGLYTASFGWMRASFFCLSQSPQLVQPIWTTDSIGWGYFSTDHLQVIRKTLTLNWVKKEEEEEDVSKKQKKKIRIKWNLIGWKPEIPTMLLFGAWGIDIERERVVDIPNGQKKKGMSYLRGWINDH